MARHWITVVSGRGESGREKVKSAFDYLNGALGPFEEVWDEDLGPYSEIGGMGITYRSPEGLVIKEAFDRAGFSSLHILESSTSSLDPKQLSLEARRGIGIKSRYRDRSPYTWKDPESSDYFD